MHVIFSPVFFKIYNGSDAFRELKFPNIQRGLMKSLPPTTVPASGAPEVIDAMNFWAAAEIRDVFLS